MYRIFGIDSVGGQAVINQDDQWYLISMDNAWQPTKLSDVADAIRWSEISSEAQRHEILFEKLDDAIAYVRNTCLSQLIAPQISFDEIKHLIPAQVVLRVHPAFVTHQEDTNSSEDALVGRAFLSLDNHEFEKASQAFETALELVQSDQKRLKKIQILMGLTMAYIGQRNWMRSLQAQDDILKSHPIRNLEAIIWENITDLHMLKGDLNEALISLNTSMTMQRANSRVRSTSNDDRMSENIQTGEQPSDLRILEQSLVDYEGYHFAVRHWDVFREALQEITRAKVSISLNREQHLSELTALQEVARVVNSTLNLQEIFERVIRELATVFQYPLISLYTIEGDHLTMQASHGNTPEEIAQFKSIPIGGGITGRAWRSGEAQLVVDVHDVPDYIPAKKWVTSEIAVPIRSDTEVLGVLCIQSGADDPLDDTDLQLLRIFAGQVATAMSNARHYSQMVTLSEELEKRVEERTRELRSQQTEATKSQAILESVADGVMVSNQLGEIILFNAAAERILDLRRDEVLGRAASDLARLYGKGASKWVTMFREWSARRTAYAGEFLAEQIEVGDKVISVHVSPAVHDEELVGIVSVFRDISREVAADRIKSEFVATVSHELHTPMTSIKSYADLLLLGAAGEITMEQRRFLQIVKNNADRLSLLVNDLLDISRSEQGGVDLDVRLVDLREIVKDVVLSLEGREANEGRNVHIRTELPSSLPKIEGDYDRITQIIMNLASNAYQYTPDEGTITLRAKPDDKGIQIDVVDTGIGIPEEDQPRIFERFFRGEDPIVMRTAGTGLGLAIVQRLVNMHGGQISFESKQGVGTTFHVWLPYKVGGE